MRAFPYQSIYDQGQTPPWDRLTDTKDHRLEAMANWTNGVYPGSDGWKVEPGAGMTVTVSPGMGRIQGVFCYDEPGPGGALEPRTLALQAAHTSLDRIDLVVVRHQDSTSMRKTDWYIVTGTPSLNPTAPVVTRNADVYELCVAKVFVARGTNTISAQRITDTRLDYTLCGLCTTRVMDAAIEDIKTLLSTAIDGTTAGHLQSQMQSTNYAITDSALKSTFGSAATLKSILQDLGVDYIIERGTTNGWGWEKWASGKMIKRLRVQRTVSITTASGGFYVSPIQTFDLGGEEFVTGTLEPFFTATVINSDYQSWGTLQGFPTSTQVKMRVACTQSISGSVMFNIMFIGRWK